MPTWPKLTDLPTAMAKFSERSFTLSRTRRSAVLRCSHGRAGGGAAGGAVGGGGGAFGDGATIMPLGVGINVGAAS
jgi:hypothetical protein